MFHFLCALFAASLPLAAGLPATKSSVWTFDIWEGPAPPPDQGPPLSAHASRDKSLLRYQISGIVGAYAVTVLFLLTLLFIVGRRLRRKAQTSNPSLNMQMIQSTPAEYELAKLKSMGTPATVSTVTTNGHWPSPTKESGSPNLTWTSPASHGRNVSAQESVITFDESVIEDDKARAQTEMERLYAAVMEHDAKHSKTIYDAKKSGSSASSPQSPRSPKSPKSPREFPEFQHLRSQDNPAQQQPVHNSSEPYSRPSTNSRSSNKLSKASPLGFLNPTHSRGSSAASNLSSRIRRSIRGLPISPPMGSPDLARSFDNHDAEREPLSPRQYNPGPPPMPPTEKQVAFARTPVEIGKAPGSRAAAPAGIYTGSTTNSKTSLPFRSPTFQRNYATPPQSAPPTKTTILEKRETLRQGPRTGVPQTPYSPYTPFSVTTPITPSFLVTKEDRKKQAKGLRVLNEEDMVKNDDDMWGI